MLLKAAAAEVEVEVEVEEAGAAKWGFAQWRLLTPLSHRRRLST
jgi:hypothetical protein